jgi:arylsulfatase A-like enzyme
MHSFSVLGCDRQESIEAPLDLAAPVISDAPERPNVVLILIDTVRADHTSLESYRRDTTPGIQAFAAKGQTYRQHFANAPWTRPSVASILTGLLPPSHGTQWGNMTDPQGEVDLLPEALETIPELLQPHGYSTHAFSTNPVVSRHFGYGQGFDQFDQLPGTLEDDRRVIESTMRTLDPAHGGRRDIRILRQPGRSRRQ